MADANSKTILYTCGAMQDAVGNSARPGAVAVRDGRIVASGEVETVRAAVHADESIDLPDTLILPAMVNVHAHLDLHAIGPVPCDNGFVNWVADHVMPWRADATEAQLEESVADELKASRAAGVGAIGDIAASVAAVRARYLASVDRAVPGVSWVECVGYGAQADASIERLEAVAAALCQWRSRDNSAATGITVHSNPVHVDVQPHAPYSADAKLYALPKMCGSTHLAETPEEAQFVFDATGPIAEFRKRMGRWTDDMRGTGLSPVAHFCQVAKPLPWVIAHCNYVSDADIALLRDFADGSSITVAYCPIASEYFGHLDHRYRDMLAAGINVAIGTDSILCQSPNETQPMGILPQLRRLFERDRTDAQTLLGMATVNGINALSASGDSWKATLSAGDVARLIGVRFDVNDSADPLIQVLRNREPVQVI